MKKLGTLHDGGEDGFTIIEILVVMLIIGILTAIAVPMYINQRGAAVNASLKSDVRNAAIQIEAYQGLTDQPVPSFTVESNNGDFPTISPAAGYSLSSDNILTEIKVSDGTTLRIDGSGELGRYTITGTNPGGSDDGRAGIVYDPMYGGIVD